MPAKPAPPGVVTGARLFLLDQVRRGRVRWLINACVAMWIPEDGEAEDKTVLFMELVRSGWARVEPVDMSEHPPPADTGTELTGAGEDVLIQARRSKGKR